MDIRQVVNVLELLEFFAEHGRPASLAEISKHFGWPRSSTFNLLGSLANRGYLYEPKAREGYYPSPTWLPLIQKIDRAAPVSPELQELVQTLCDQTGETAGLLVFSGMQALFIAVAESRQAVRYTAHVGKTVPLHSSASGRALLSQLTDRERNAILRRTAFERYTENSPMSQEMVEREILLSRQRGYFESRSEYSRDLNGLAMPFQHAGRQMAVLVGGPIVRVGHIRDEVIFHMREAISRLVDTA